MLVAMTLGALLCVGIGSLVGSCIAEHDSLEVAAD
jgi:hypothetical protein